MLRLRMLRLRLFDMRLFPVRLLDMLMLVVRLLGFLGVVFFGIRRIGFLGIALLNTRLSGGGPRTRGWRLNGVRREQGEGQGQEKRHFHRQRLQGCPGEYKVAPDF